MRVWAKFNKSVSSSRQCRLMSERLENCKRGKPLRKRNKTSTDPKVDALCLNKSRAIRLIKLRSTARWHKRLLTTNPSLACKKSFLHRYIEKWGLRRTGLSANNEENSCALRMRAALGKIFVVVSLRHAWNIGAFFKQPNAYALLLGVR